MKRWVLIPVILLVWLFSATGAWAEQPEPDWLALLLDAAVAGDREAGLAAAAGWNADESRVQLDYDELFLLSKLITWEAGSSWLTEELRLGVGEVALNRVASPEFRHLRFPGRPAAQPPLRRGGAAPAAGGALPGAPGGLRRSRRAGQGTLRVPGSALRQHLFLREPLPGAV